MEASVKLVAVLMTKVCRFSVENGSNKKRIWNQKSLFHAKILLLLLLWASIKWGGGDGGYGDGDLKLTLCMLKWACRKAIKTGLFDTSFAIVHVHVQITSSLSTPFATVQITFLLL